ncbi:unnamed protein product [Prorocentrum cordatum]|uniref:Syntaxin N-terminal domain-containing protein n=1 Tax=Prorocentrum cordatum TaxID=2364126 RepID=A0ABN9VKP1_9DINO|nr:unnamed protein product [Polarella glacialis]
MFISGGGAPKTKPSGGEGQGQSPRPGGTAGQASGDESPLQFKANGLEPVIRAFKGHAAAEARSLLEVKLKAVRAPTESKKAGITRRANGRHRLARAVQKYEHISEELTEHNKMLEERM